MKGEFDPTVYAAMQTGKPYKTYKKTILGSILVRILSPFDHTEEEFILKGDPKKGDGLLDVWSEMEDVFFTRKNKRHFELGELILYTRPEIVEEAPRTIEAYTDAELTELLSSKYYKIMAEVNKATSEAVMFRLIQLAEDMEKSEKIINLLKGRLSEIQANKRAE